MGTTRIRVTLPHGMAPALILAGVLAVAPAGVSAAAAAAGPSAAEAGSVPTDPAQASVAGELALQRNDCRSASEDFAIA